MTALEDLLNPRSIAIVGASDDPTRIGGRPLAHMIKQRFDGAIYPVNPKRDTVQGLRAYPGLAEIEGELDFVLVAVPASMVAEQVRVAASKGARTVMIFSSGFAEVGPEGEAMQDELTRLARETGVRVIGPNCLGAFAVLHLDHRLGDARARRHLHRQPVGGLWQPHLHGRAPQGARHRLLADHRQRGRPARGRGGWRGPTARR